MARVEKDDMVQHASLKMERKNKAVREIKMVQIPFIGNLVHASISSRLSCKS